MTEINRAAASLGLRVSDFNRVFRLNPRQVSGKAWLDIRCYYCGQAMPLPEDASPVTFNHGDNCQAPAILADLAA